MSDATFMDQVLHGDVVMDEIDDFVGKWHHEDESERPIADFLGMTQAEYDLWAEKPASLRLIVAAREDQLPLYEAISRYSQMEPVAARAADPEAARVVLQWLRETGRLSG